MNTTAILASICTYMNARFNGVKFIQAPTNAAAPKGTYVAVKLEGVTQQGQELVHTLPGAGYGRFVNAATISLTEVEGNGDIARMALQIMQSREFQLHAKNTGYTIWNVGSVFPLDTFDGKFFVRQWRGTIEANFVDEIARESKDIIMKVTGTIQSENTVIGERITGTGGEIITTAAPVITEEPMEVERD